VADRVDAYAEKALTPDQRADARVTASAIRYRARLRDQQAKALADWAGQ
jgi:hypothetical protein